MEKRHATHTLITDRLAKLYLTLVEMKQLREADVATTATRARYQALDVEREKIISDIKASK